MPARDRSTLDRAATAFQPEDVLRQAQVQDAALAPDGSMLVYSRRVIADNAYRTHLWIVSWLGGVARQLTHAAVNDTRPSSPPTAGHSRSSRIAAVGGNPGSCRSTAANRVWRLTLQATPGLCIGRQTGDGY